LFAEKLLRNSLDMYTGDLLSMDEIKHYVSNRNVLIALYNNETAGVLQFEVKNKIVWLGHIAIDEKFRGKGIANELVKKYIQDNQIVFNTKYQLWVIQDNEAAVKLYRKFGFVYGNKSSTSLLKD
jgi:ribosomal protein S18 acetylase RimI-like enzyme